MKTLVYLTTVNYVDSSKDAIRVEIMETNPSIIEIAKPEESEGKNT
mgnify:CR=1 FL=1